MKLFNKIFCTKKLSQVKYSMVSNELILKGSDKKYYYFQKLHGKEYVKVLRKEDGEELILYENWLD